MEETSGHGVGETATAHAHSVEQLAEPSHHSPCHRSDDRLQSAENRRKALLSQRKAAAAADVARSKSIASSRSALRAQNAAEARLKIEEKLMSSEERRQQQLEQKRQSALRFVQRDAAGQFICHALRDSDSVSSHDTSGLDDSVDTQEEEVTAVPTVQITPPLKPSSESKVAEPLVFTATMSPLEMTSLSLQEEGSLAKCFEVSHKGVAQAQSAQVQGQPEALHHGLMSEEHKAQARLHLADIASKAALCRAAQRRLALQRRVRLIRDTESTRQRREARIQKKVEAAHAHWVHVQAVQKRARAIRTLQSWFRTCLQKSRSSVSPPPEEPGASRKPTLRQQRAIEKAAAILRTEPVLKSATILKTILQPQGKPRASGARPHSRSVSSVAAASKAGIEPLDPSEVPFSSFDACAATLQKRSVLAAAQVLVKAMTQAWDVLQHAQVACESYPEAGPMHKLRIDSKPAVVTSPRTFLASLLVAFFPEDLLVTDSHAEGQEGLVESHLTDEFHLQFVANARKFVSQLRSSMAIVESVRDLVEDSSQLIIHTMSKLIVDWMEFAELFMAWKTGDGHRMANTMIPTFVELTRRLASYTQEYNTRAGREDAGLAELCEGTQAHIDRLRAQIVSLVGSEAAAAWEKRSMEQVEQRSSPKTATESAAASASAIADPHKPVASSAAPSAATHQKMLSNHEILHELMINPDFTLPSPRIPDELCTSVRYTTPSSSHERSVSHLSTDLSKLLGDSSTSDAGNDPQCSVSHWGDAIRSAHQFADVVADVVSTFREKLCGIVPHKRDFHARISEVLDPTLYANSAAHGGVTIHDCVRLCRYTLDQILLLEAPARNNETNDWWKLFQENVYRSSTLDDTAAAAHAIAFCMYKFRQLDVDMTNAQLRALVPFLNAHGRGVEYDRNKSREVYGDVAQLPGTTGWLQETAARFPQGVAHVRDHLMTDAGMTQLVADGIIALMEQPHAIETLTGAARASGHSKARVVASVEGATPIIKDISIPETLYLDAPRLTRFQDVLQRSVLLAGIWSCMHSLVVSASADPSTTRHVNSKTAADVESYMDMLLADSSLRFDELVAGVITCTNDLLALAGKQPLNDRTDSSDRHSCEHLRKLVGEALSPANPLHALMRKRCSDLLRSRLCRHMPAVSDATLLETWKEAVAFSASPTLQRSLTVHGVHTIEKVAEHLARIINHNTAVFGDSYRAVISALSTE